MSRTKITLVLSLFSVAACSNMTDGLSESQDRAQAFNILVNQDSDRIYISVINVSDFNFRWDPYPRAEKTGDLSIEIKRDGLIYPSAVLREEVELKEGLMWMQSGSGVAFARRKSLLKKRYKLTEGCYEVTVHATNRAAVNAYDTRNGNPGPIVEGKSAVIEACFKD